MAELSDAAPAVPAAPPFGLSTRTPWHRVDRDQPARRADVAELFDMVPVLTTVQVVEV